MAGPLAVVIGASRGVGFALVKALIKADYTVVATVRKGAEELRKIGAEVVEGVDVTADDGFQSVTAALGDRQICLLIVAAGVQEVDTFETVTKDCTRRQLETNALGPLFVVKALQRKLQEGAKVALITSKLASITCTEATGGELYGYRISKASLNVIGATLALDLKRLNKSPVVLIHPGAVNTDMLRAIRKQRGVPDDKLALNTISPEESAAGTLRLIDGLHLENSGTYWGADSGTLLEW